MLRTNSKKARENIKKYIVEHFCADGYDLPQVPVTFEEHAVCILETFRNEKKYDNSTRIEWFLFVRWCQGLPTILDVNFWYNRSSRVDLEEILEAGDDEYYKHTDAECDMILTKLIYRELISAHR